MSSSTSCSLFLRLTKPEEALTVLLEEVGALLAEVDTFAVPASSVKLDLLMLEAAVEIKPVESCGEA